MNHQDIVERVKNENTDLFTSVEGMLDFVLKVIAALPETGVGLVRSKLGNENTAVYQGTPVRVNRVIYPDDGQVVKILTNSGPNGGNGPTWALGNLEPQNFVPLAATEPEAPPADPPTETNDDELRMRLTTLEGRVTSLEAQFAEFWRSVGGLFNDMSLRIADLENKPAPTFTLPALVVRGNTSRVWGHGHAIDLPVTLKPKE